MKEDNSLAENETPASSGLPQWALAAIGVVSAVLLLVAVMSPGCHPSAERQIEDFATSGGRADSLELALNSLRSRAEFNAGRGAERALSYLNQWAEHGDIEKTDWKVDPLLSKLPGDLPFEESLKEDLERRVFPQADIYHLQESLWARELVTWIVERPVEPAFTPWLDAVGAKRGQDVRAQLATAQRLFDWTICNIRLETMPPTPKAAAASAGVSAESRSPSFRGIPGPGYTRLPWQVLLHGRGDAWERSRAFMCLARQAGIDVVMLAIHREGAAVDAHPWLAAAFIDEQLYLFDAELGLPIPGPDDAGIATLEQVVADPGLLRALDLNGHKYPITDADLKKVVALVDTPLTAMSRRMKALQAALKGERRMVLMPFKDDLPDRLRKSPQLRGVTLWRVSVDAEVYAMTSERVRNNNPALRSQYYKQFGMYLDATPLRRGREAYIRGIFTAEPPKRGAREWLLLSRTSESDLRRLAISETMREALGIEQRLPEQEPQRTQAIDAIIAGLQYQKEDATFFLAMTLFEEGKFDLATEWFRDRILEGDKTSGWIGAARYNLGRCSEALGKYEEARTYYLNDESPQRIGNILRASAVKRRIEKEKATPATEN